MLLYRMTSKRFHIIHAHWGQMQNTVQAEMKERRDKKKKKEKKASEGGKTETQTRIALAVELKKPQTGGKKPSSRAGTGKRRGGGGQYLSAASGQTQTSVGAEINGAGGMGKNRKKRLVGSKRERKIPNGSGVINKKQGGGSYGWRKDLNCCLELGMNSIERKSKKIGRIIEYNRAFGPGRGGKKNWKPRRKQKKKTKGVNMRQTPAAGKPKNRVHSVAKTQSLQQLSAVRGVQRRPKWGKTGWGTI